MFSCANYSSVTRTCRQSFANRELGSGAQAIKKPNDPAEQGSMAKRHRAGVRALILTIV